MIARTIAGLTIGQRFQLDRIRAIAAAQSARYSPDVPGKETVLIEDDELTGEASATPIDERQ